MAFALFNYAFVKFFGLQFGEPSPDMVMKPVATLDTHSLFWIFMSASKSYKIITGCAEVITGMFLLFMRTATLGALLSIGLLINLLALNIAYDTLVKVFIINLILVASLLLVPDIEKLVNFFLLKKTSSLTHLPILFPKFNYSSIRLVLKFSLIAFVVFTYIRQGTEYRSKFFRSYYTDIDGVYEVKDFYINGQYTLPLISDSIRWKNMIISRFNRLAVQFMNDSLAYYNIKVDSTQRLLTLTVWNDSSYKSSLHYNSGKNGIFQFNGVYRHDSIDFTSRKIDFSTYPLYKDKGKIKWVWW